MGQQNPLHSQRGFNMKGKSFTWNDRLTLINHFKPSDEQACTVFGISQDELNVARNQLKAGVFSLSTTLDVGSYGTLFASSEGTDESTTVTTTKATVRTKPTVTSTKAAPESATAKSREPKKRGRKGDKITQVRRFDCRVASEQALRQHW
jgi:hypothetical protein